MYRHYWTSHRGWAMANNIPDQRTKCERCGKVLSRPDFCKRHQDKACRGKRTKGRSPGSASEQPPLLPKDDTQ
jgi:hypothetical protein